MNLPMLSLPAATPLVGRLSWLRRTCRGFAISLCTVAPGLGTAFAEDEPRVTALEVVTDRAAIGDGGNAWGGHQCRIVRTRDGVFTAYTVAGRDETSREWRLAWRRAEGWTVIASGLAGREPVNLLASPDGTLHVVGWPDGRARCWSGRPSADTVMMRERPLPGLSEGHWPYNSAGIDSNGRLCVVSSEGERPGTFRWAMRDPATGTWTAGATSLDYRHCYTYVLPDAAGGLSLVSTRDVLWETLGYTKPANEFDYVLNAFGWWRTPNTGREPLRRIASVEEPPTRRDPVVLCSVQDAYQDARGRLHVCYRRAGRGTAGGEEARYAVFSPEGNPLDDVKSPWSAGLYGRVFQDDRGRFYFLGSDGVIYHGGTGAVSFENKTRLKLGGNLVDPAGFGISAPRTGTPPGNVMDVVFPSGGGGVKWIYVRVQLH